MSMSDEAFLAQFQGGLEAWHTSAQSNAWGALFREARRARSEESRLATLCQNWRELHESTAATAKKAEAECARLRAENEALTKKAAAEIVALEDQLAATDARIAELEARLRDQTAATEDNYQRAANVEQDRDEWKEAALKLEQRAEEADKRVAALEVRLRGLVGAGRNLALATPDRVLRAELERFVRLAAEALP